MTPETQNPVEAVARAICSAFGKAPDHWLTGSLTKRAWQRYERHAEAAIAALSAPVSGVAREDVLEILRQVTESPASGPVVWTDEKHAARDRQIEHAAGSLLALLSRSPPEPSSLSGRVVARERKRRLEAALSGVAAQVPMTPPGGTPSNSGDPHG